MWIILAISLAINVILIDALVDTRRRCKDEVNKWKQKCVYASQRWEEEYYRLLDKIDWR